MAFPYPRLVVDEFGDQTLGDVACSATNCLTVWHDLRNDAGDIYGARIRFNGTVVNVGGSPIHEAPESQSWARVASDGDVFAVVWEDAVIWDRGSHIQAKIIDSDGNEVAPMFPRFARNENAVSRVDRLGRRGVLRLLDQHAGKHLQNERIRRVRRAVHVRWDDADAADNC
ncbi:MAG: hypothetical protein M5R36_18900 [Deltaproteobacteria bacterium]|nr:hypothetical protein [Deltaproteobacteria bacterium]